MVTSGKSTNETQGIYDAEIERLIELAIIDGQISENERQVLLRKAQSKGIDLDEFKMVLDARLSEYNQYRLKKPASIKFGEVRKCPNCGAEIKSFQTKCEQCGFEFRNVEAVNSAQKLFDLLQEVELRKSEKIAELQKDEKNKPFFNKLLDNSNQNAAKFYKSMNSGLVGKATSKLLGDLGTMIDESNENDPIAKIEKQAEAEQASIIKNFPVPNTKEDLLELLAMATSNAYDNDGVIGSKEQVWLQKTDQIYQKTIICASDDTSLMEKATYMIVSLMKRLPQGNYKNFTTIPKNMMYIFNDATVAHNEVINSKPVTARENTKTSPKTDFQYKKDIQNTHMNKASINKNYTRRKLNDILDLVETKRNLNFDEKSLIFDQVEVVKKYKNRLVWCVIIPFIGWIYIPVVAYRKRKAIKKLDKYCTMLLLR